MRGLVTLACLLGAVSGLAAEEVKLGPLKAEAPKEWKISKPTSQMRVFQCTWPKAEGAEVAQMIVYYFGKAGAGGVKANLARWKMQMAPLDGEAKTTSMKIAGTEASYLDVNGTFMGKSNARLLGVIVPTSNGPYYIKVTGPAKTIAKHKEAFDKWLKALK